MNHHQEPLSYLLNDQPTRTGRKNTRKWCKGKVGREHDWELGVPWAKVKGWTWVKEDSAMIRNFKIDVCKACGKHRWHRR